MSRKIKRPWALAALVLAAGMLLCLAEVWAGGGRRALTLLEYLQFPRIWVSFLFGVGGAALLVWVKIKGLLRLLLLVLIFAVFAVMPIFDEVTFWARMAPHPSPLCALTKPVMFSLQMKQFTLPAVFAGVLALIGVLSLIGNKLFCGWVCPIGALQEIAYGLPLKKIKPPFAMLNVLRLFLLAAFGPVLIFFGISLYSYFNPFEMLHWPLGTDFWALYAWGVVAILLAASLLVFRPFCHSVCPIGFLTWLLEPVSVMRIRLDADKCNHCRACVGKAPCLAMDSILESKRVRPDCYACGRCIEACPAGALKFGIK